MIVNKDGRVVVYSGDDAQFDYVYRFVSAGRYVAGDRASNMRLFSEGTLSVARFEDDGSVTVEVPDALGEEQARLEVDLYLKAWQASRPDVEAHLIQ